MRDIIKTNPETRTAVFLFTLALGIRFLYLILFPAGQLISDPNTYLIRATDLAETGRYIDDLGDFTAYMPPGTSFLLIPFVLIGNRWLMDIAFALISALTVSIAFLFFIKSGVNRNRATIAGILLSIIPGWILYTGFPNSEVPFTLLLFAAFFVLVAYERAPRFMLAGFLIGISMLFRTIGFFALPLAIIFEWRRRKMRIGELLFATAFIAIGCVIAVAPWSIRNMVRLGTPAISTNTGVNLRMGCCDNAVGTYDASIDTLPETMSETERNRIYIGQSLDWLKHNPAAWVISIPKKVFYLWGMERCGMDWRNIANHRLKWISGYIWHVIWYAILAFGIWAAVKHRREFTRDPIFALSVLSVIGVTIFHTFFFGAGRFHFPVAWAPIYWIAMELSPTNLIKKT